jgi:hypothetical protein
MFVCVCPRKLSKGEYEWLMWGTLCGVTVCVCVSSLCACVCACVQETKYYTTLINLINTPKLHYTLISIHIKFLHSFEQMFVLPK